MSDVNDWLMDGCMDGWMELWYDVIRYGCYGCHHEVMMMIGLKYDKRDDQDSFKEEGNESIQSKKW